MRTERPPWILVGFLWPKFQQKENYKKHQERKVEVVELKGVQWMEVELRRTKLE